MHFNTQHCRSKRLTISRLSYRSVSHTDSLAVSRLIDKHATRVHASAPGLLALQ